jgi:hypothetical protein
LETACFNAARTPLFFKWALPGRGVADPKKDEKGDYEFVAPDFDEHAFIHREMVSFRTTAILFAWGIVAAAVSWGLFLTNPRYGWAIGLAVCAAFGYSLKVLFPRLGADIAHFKRREWMGTGFLFFFTWLSFFMLAINPPITDVAPPQVFLDTAPVHEAGSNVTIAALATDNHHVTGLQVEVQRDGKPVAATLQDKGAGHQVATLAAAQPGTYRVVATASDGRNADAHANLTFVVGNVLHLKVPAGALDGTNFVSATVDGSHACTKDDIAAAATCLRAVFLRQANGDPVQMDTADGTTWKAEASYKGWTEGANNVTLVAQFQERFLGAERAPGGEVVAANPTTITVQGATGTHAVTLPDQPPHRAIQVPGPELGLLAVVLAGAALVASRRSKS